MHPRRIHPAPNPTANSATSDCNENLEANPCHSNPENHPEIINPRFLHEALSKEDIVKRLNIAITEFRADTALTETKIRFFIQTIKRVVEDQEIYIF